MILMTSPGAYCIKLQPEKPVKVLCNGPLIVHTVTRFQKQAVPATACVFLLTVFRLHAPSLPFPHPTLNDMKTKILQTINIVNDIDNISRLYTYRDQIPVVCCLGDGLRGRGTGWAQDEQLLGFVVQLGQTAPASQDQPHTTNMKRRRTMERRSET